MSTTLEKRFHAKVSKSSGCWLWTGSTRHGYGCISVNGNTEQAHRISWELHRGAIPCGMRVLHSCDNPTCVKPEHLFLGTAQDNSDDMKRKGRQRFFIGEKHPHASLSDRAVKVIRQLWPSISQSELARSFNVSRQIINNIVRRKSWTHLP